MASSILSKEHSFVLCRNDRLLTGVTCNSPCRVRLRSSLFPQDDGLLHRIVVPALDYDAGQLRREFALLRWEQRNLSVGMIRVSRGCLAGCPHCEREAQHCHSPPHFRAPTCFTCPSTSNGNPSCSTPIAIFFIGNVEATWKTASSRSPSCVHGVSGDSGNFCIRHCELGSTALISTHFSGRRDSRPGTYLTSGPCFAPRFPRQHSK